MTTNSTEIPQPSSYATGETTPFTGSVERHEVTLIAGSNFLVCGPLGNLRPGGLNGFYAFDTRMLSASVLLVNGEEPRPAASHQESSRHLEAAAILGDPTTASMLMTRTLTLTDELVDEIRIVNLTSDPLDLVIEAAYATDFADVFDVKSGRDVRRGFQGSGPDGDRLLLKLELDDVVRQLHISADRPCGVGRDRLRFVETLSGRDEWAATITAIPESDEEGTTRRPFVLGSPKLEIWQAQLPKLATSDVRLQRAWDRSAADLGSLRLWNEASPSYPALAAGVPWFMTLFGRDSMLAGTMSLLLNQRPLLGSLEALAHRQGTRHEPRTGEEPGKILHEIRSGASVRAPEGWGEVYYGTVDATPLFVNAVNRARLWGAPHDFIAGLLPACEAAVDWIVMRLDTAGGLLTYHYDPEHGLANQGWKDSYDGIRYADGSLVGGDVALVEPQGYAVAALEALGDLRAAFATGDPDSPRDRAQALRNSIETRYWMDETGYYAVAVADGGRTVDSITTNPGHLLWARAITPDRAGPVAARMRRPDLASGFGLRTLSAANPGYNPLSYHCGSVWPHDSALGIAGLYTYGEIEAAHMLTLNLLDAIDAFAGSAPELFGGFDRDRFAPPIPYPTTCSPQAWSAAATIVLVEAMLGFDPDVPAGVLRLRPRIPDGIELEIDAIQLGDGRTVGLRASGDDVEVADKPDDIEISIG